LANAGGGGPVNLVQLGIVIDDSRQLGDFLKTEASRLGLRLSFDTHYDARNWALSWWRGRTLHRLDFQPMGNGVLSITHYRDQFRFLPRLLRWAHNAIPLFPYFAHTESDNHATEQLPFNKQSIAGLVSHSVDASEPAKSGAHEA
jgi:hypothetical protein